MSSSGHRSIFSRLSSSGSSTRSKSSSSYEALTSSTSTIPKGCREFQRSRYAKDGKGFDFNMTYPYCTSTATASDVDFVEEMPVGCRDFKLRYAKDGKGHDFTKSYSYAPANDSTTQGAQDITVMPRQTMRYAKDGKGMDFTKTYPYGKN